MFRYVVDSEYKPLKAVLLCRPHPKVGNIDNPRAVLHVRKIDYAIAEKEYGQIGKLYKRCKIKTSVINVRRRKESNDRFVFNLMFTRDLFFMTPQGAIISRMSSGLRQEEVKYAQRAIRGMGIRIRKVIRDNGTFEGADALWVNDRLVAVGVGNRTNTEGFRQIKEELKRDGVECVAVPAPHGVLHLLGALQFVDSALTLVRADLVDSEISSMLRHNWIKVINIPENIEIQKKQAMNFVTIAPKEIIMPAGCPQTRRIYERAGIKIAAEIRITQLINGGGGLACATGILARA